MNFPNYIESLQKVSVQNLQPAVCLSTLEVLQKDLLAFPWDTVSNEEISAQASVLLPLFWQTRLNIHDALSTFNPECAALARKLFHHLRDAEDFVGEFAFAAESLDPYKLKFQDQPVPIFDRKFYPAYYVRPELDKTPFQFQNGDVVIARGISFFSAIISQISDNKAHFSHSFVIEVDPTTKVPQTIESYVGKGVRNYEINHALKNENVRLLVLRPKNQELGAKAGAAALEAAKKALPYDYEMDFNDDAQMSCVEVPTYSYKKASGGVLKIPLHPAQLLMENETFLRQMHLRRGDLITPDDLETDPNFDLVLDWKDARLVRDSRQKDAVLSEIIRWLGDLHYQFQDTPKSWLVTKVILPLRQTFLWPAIAWIPGVPELDKHIPPSTLRVMTVLDQVSEKLLTELKKKDEDFKTQNGRVMTNTQLREVLENIRAQDFEKHQNGDSTLIHKMFRPE